MLVVQSDVEELERLYKFVDKARILEFLNPELVKLLLEAHNHVRAFFPNDPLELEVRDDPEELELTKLVLTAVTDLDVTDMLQKLDQLGHTWWLDNMNRAGGKLLLDAD